MATAAENYEKVKETIGKLPIGMSFYFILRGNVRINISCIRSTFANGVAYPVTIGGIFPDGSMFYSTVQDSLNSQMQRLAAIIYASYNRRLADDIVVITDVVPIRTTN
jgi:hypothetical protein